MHLVGKLLGVLFKLNKDGLIRYNYLKLVATYEYRLVKTYKVLESI